MEAVTFKCVQPVRFKTVTYTKTTQLTIIVNTFKTKTRQTFIIIVAAKKVDW